MRHAKQLSTQSEAQEGVLPSTFLPPTAHYGCVVNEKGQHCVTLLRDHARSPEIVKVCKTPREAIDAATEMEAMG